MGQFSDEFLLITPARLGLTGAKAQVSVGWKEIHAVVERSNRIGLKCVYPGFRMDFI